MQWPRVSVCDWWAHGTHTDRHGQSMRAFILSNVPKSASLPYSGLSGTKLPHNAILHSEKIQDLLISPPPVAPCFLLPAIIALLVWSHKQAEAQDGCTKVSQYSIHTIPTPVKQQPWLAASCRHSHQCRSPQGKIHILEIPGMSGEHTFFYTPWGYNTQ